MTNALALVQYSMLGLSFITATVSAVESTLHSLIDVRVTSTDSSTSYLNAGYGKLGFDNGDSLTLSQLGLSHRLKWQSGVSTHLVVNAHSQNDELKLGLTEGYVGYKSLVNQAGYRWQSKLGIFYPRISLENNGIAWSSIATLSSSMINTWIGEEVRALGSELTLTRLGKFNHAPYDISFSVASFINNDPTGSLLSWHGWTMSNRQTRWTEKRTLPAFMARQPGNPLAEQAQASDPFKEIDSRLGFYLKTEFKLPKKIQFSMGYYDNNAKPYLVKNGQYAWHTKFLDLGLKLAFSKSLTLTGQYLVGSTLMQNPQQQDMVNNDFSSGYLTLTKRWRVHQVALRAELFDVLDNDFTLGDNNNEHGSALTLSYHYRVSKALYLASEFNWLQSYRPARQYLARQAAQIDKQSQLALRYYF